MLLVVTYIKSMSRLFFQIQILNYSLTIAYRFLVDTLLETQLTDVLNEV